MRTSILSLFIALFVAPLFGQARDHSRHAEAVVQPVDASVSASATRVFNLDAHQFSYTVSPSPFVVNQGDVVTINVTATDTVHGWFLERYDEQAATIAKGNTHTVQFVANTAGRFTYFCTFVCGTGHSGMSGTFTVNAVVPPTIVSVSPATGSTAGGTMITIIGTNFATGAGVTIGGVATNEVDVVSATMITAVSPLGPTSELAGQPRDVTVTNADGQSVTKARAFTYFVPPPSITSVTPASTSVNGGATVTIKGAGFTSAVVTSVKFGDVPATNVAVVDAVTMTALAPAHAAGTVDVTVQVGNKTATKSSAFTYAVPASRRRAVRP